MSNLRMAMSYGNFSETMKKQIAEEHPVIMPMGLRRLPEHSELPGITKGWRSRVYEHVAPKRSEVREINRAQGPEQGGNMMMQVGKPEGRSAMQLDQEVEAGRRAALSQSYSESRLKRTPLLARTVVNAPARLDCSRIREANRFPKSPSASLTAVGRSFDGCRRTCSSSVIFNP
ncbi:unnamed protein product [Effrenium voratum]|nr:unnamed protein product [Effrenium voratum]